MELPWYKEIERIVAPTEGASSLALGIIIFASLLILWKGSATVKAAWVVYLVSP